MNIGPLSVGGDSPCRCIAEMSNAHNGDLARAHRIIDAAKAAGADAAKLQCYSVEELIALRGDGPAPEPWGSQGWTMRQLYGKAQTPHAWFPELVQHCRDIGLPWFSSVFGAESLALLESLDCPAYKIARLDNQSHELLAAVRATRKPLIVSVATEREAANLVGEVYAPEWQRHEKVGLLLYCPPGYPQTSFNFADAFNEQRCDGDVDGCAVIGSSYDGFSFHGTDPFPCVIAAARGAKVIEAHFMLDDEPSELEANVSLTQTQFARMIADVRRPEEMLG